jgi:predicted PurR-regulated permease PerM
MPQAHTDPDVTRLPLLHRLTVVLLFVLLLGTLLVVTRNFLYPLALGTLFAFLLLPVVRWLERLGLPRILANLVTIIIGIGAVYGVMLFLYRRLSDLLSDLPDLKNKVSGNLDIIINEVGARFGSAMTAQTREALLARLEGLLRFTGDSLSDVLTATGNTLLAVGLMPVYVFMILYYRDKFGRFLLMLVPRRNRSTASGILHQTAHVTMQYMTGMFIVVMILAVVNSAGFLIIGLEYAVLFGVTAAIWNFIPYFGTIIGYAIPFVFALFTGSGPDVALLVLLQFVIIQFTENNILTPNIVGGMVRMNPFVIILGVLGGGMLWGLPGMFVVVPVVAMVKVVCQEVPRLRPIAFLLGDSGTEQHSITGRKIRRFFAFSTIARKETGINNGDGA